MRFFTALAALILLACEPIRTGEGRSGEDADGGAGAAGAGGHCNGFLDVTGKSFCDLSCLETDECEEASTCSEGVNGPGFCLAHRCIYLQSNIFCSEPDDCSCGICGADSRCYEDRLGTCGGCQTTGQPTGEMVNPACTECIAACKVMLGDYDLTCCPRKGCFCDASCLGYQ